MRNFIIAAIMVFTTIFSANAQYGGVYDNYGNGYDDDRYYYDDEFDWHWDIRVRISNGIQNGLITRNEANRLYRRLEDVERKEYAYLADGIFNRWEQQEIWDDVAYLNRQVGIELYDFDRRFYGFDMAWNDLRGYPRWYYHGGFDFYRFDRRGFGTIRLGYVPRPNYNGWYRNDRNRVGREYYSERSRYRTNNGIYDNRTSRNNNDRNSRTDRYDNNRRNDNERGSRENNNPRNDNDRSSRGSYDTRNDNDRSSRGGIDNSRNNFPTPSTSERPSRSNDFPSRSSTESRSDNYGRGSGIDNSRSERNTPNPSREASTGNERRSRGGEASQAPSRSERSTPSPSNESRQGRGSTPSDASRTGESRGRRN
ncbi:hypothetical protein [Emticicia oligotrophica]|uniref:hypothetical protein n=1 Tax=Emticicia oligotrophica TaxID=312279 RepID=UPI00273BCB0F|nr:hypothetical protein [Emticicia oligotrophica]